MGLVDVIVSFFDVIVMYMDAIVGLGFDIIKISLR